MLLIVITTYIEYPNKNDRKNNYVIITIVVVRMMIRVAITMTMIMVYNALNRDQDLGVLLWY